MKAVLRAVPESRRVPYIAISAITSDTHHVVVSGWGGTDRMGEGGGPVQVVFNRLIGFRVLDERDLIEFWKATGFETGVWLFRVESGGWRDLELTKEDFASFAMWEDMHEYLVTSGTSCVSVLTTEPPLILPQAQDISAAR